MKIEIVPYYADGKIYQRTVIMEIPEEEWDKADMSKIIKKMKHKYRAENNGDGFTEFNKRLKRRQVNKEKGKDPEPFVTEQEFLQNIMRLSGMESRNFRMARYALIIGTIDITLFIGWMVFYLIF